MTGESERDPHAGQDSAPHTVEWAPPFIPAEDAPDEPPARSYSSGGGGRYRPPRQRVAWYVPIAGRFLMLFAICVLGAAIVAGASSSVVSETKTVNPPSVPVSGTPTLQIENTAGSVRIVTGSSTSISVRAELTARNISHAFARRDLDQMNVTITPDGQKVVVHTETGSGWGWWVRRQVAMTVTVPANTNLDLQVSAGDVTVDGVTGTVTTQVNAGSLTLRDITINDGSTVQVNAGSAHIDGTLASRASLNVNVNAGSVDLRLPPNTAARLDATATAGSISTSAWPAPLNVTSSDGPDKTVTCNLAAKPAGTITVRVHAGSFVLLPR
ncbi:MAG: DUF4097 family beta strand repeat-containing protein [Thermomicrobiales bacterium]